MSRRRSLIFAASSLSILAGCGSAPTASPRSYSAPLPSAAEPTSIAHEGVLAAPSNASPCAARREAALRPMQAGRGDRVVLAKRGQKTLAFVANEDDGAIHTIDLDKRDETGVTPLPGSPSALVFLSDGRLAVALRDRNEVLLLEAKDDASGELETRCRVDVASEPVGLASVVTNDAERIVVTSGYGHALGIIDTNSFEVERVVNLARDPRAVVVSGGHAFVSHVVSADISVVELESGAVDKVNTLSNKRIRSFGHVSEGDPVLGGQAFALAMNERGRLFAPMVAVDPGEPKITTAYGGAENPIKPFVGVVDLVAKKEINIPIPLANNHSLECMLPRAAAAVGDRLFVTCLGSDELVELDGRAQNAAQFIRRRVQLPRGPLGLAVLDRTAVVMSQFDRAVSIVSVDEYDAKPVTIALSRPSGEVDEAFERGRRMFHDPFEPRISRDGRACASCHPDGREDGFTWSTPDGPRQTISLAGRLPNAAPYGWFGDHGSVQNHLTHTVSRLGGQGFDTKDRADLDALVTYISRMKAPVATPNLASKELITKGRELFHDVAQGCGFCHAEGGTDRERHDIGTGRALEARMSFDTPSLMSIAGSAPYFHDGRYKSLDELLAKADDKMGHAKHLNADQRAAMVAYMESLAPAPAPELEMRQFIRRANTISLPTVANNPVEKLALRQTPPRKTLEMVDLDVDALPVVEIEPGVKYVDTNPEPQGGVVKNLLVWKSGCAAIPHHSAAHLLLDWRSTGMTYMLERCIGAPDEDGRRVWRDMTAQTVDPLPDGRLHVEEDRGFIRVGTHEFRATTSIVADAMPIGNGLAYAFRTNCAKCKEGEREKLHVVAPSDNFWGDAFFQWRTMKIDKGTSDSFSSIFNLPNLERWKKATKVEVPTGSKVAAPRNVVFRIDTSRTFSEDKPRIAVGRTTCVESSFRCD
ncbi:MAG: c-type cytochrome [Polyangiaceae bacterium]|nr:c-type cytochrome [Polyangiaceae bacterium]